MNNIFTGMLFIFFNFNLDLGSTRIGLIPSFVGYYFIFKGLSELDGFSSRFVRIMPFAKGMTVYSAVCYALDLFGAPFSDLWPLIYTLGLISIGFSFYISRSIIFGIKDIELAGDKDLSSGKLYSILKLHTVFSVLFYVFYNIPTLVTALTVIAFLLQVTYLYIFYGTKSLFYKQNTEA